MRCRRALRCGARRPVQVRIRIRVRVTVLLGVRAARVDGPLGAALDMRDQRFDERRQHDARAGVEPPVQGEEAHTCE